MTAITLPHSHENGDAVSQGQDAEDIQDLLQIIDSKSQQLWEINQKVQSLAKQLLGTSFIQQANTVPIDPQ